MGRSAHLPAARALPSWGVRGFLIVNPRSGDDSPPADALRRDAAERGVEAHVLRRGEDPSELARTAEADALGVAGGDGSLAAVAMVALARGLPFVVVPFGTRNHFARDLGLTREDPLGALAAFGGRERLIDVGRVNGRLFLNNVSLGAYADLVHRREHHRRRGEALAGLRALARLGGGPDRLRARVDGRSLAARILLVANNRYDLSLFTVGARTRLDEGVLHLYAASGWLPHAWVEREAARFEVDLTGDRVAAALDGEPVELEPPLRFEVLPRALRVLIPTDTVQGEAMHDNPEATDEEHEQAQTGRPQEEEAMRGPGHEDPDEAAKRAGTRPDDE
jgi:diacylglycerol kinase family enzyme